MVQNLRRSSPPPGLDPRKRQFLINRSHPTQPTPRFSQIFPPPPLPTCSFQLLPPILLLSPINTMSFSSLVHDLSYRDTALDRRPLNRAVSTASTMDDRRSHVSRAMSYASTTATSVSISGDISSQLHGGYSHPLSRSWQAERQLTKVRRHFTPREPPEC